MLTKLKVLRAEKNLTQAQLAKALGTTQVNVSAWETGRAVPRPPMMQKISDFFGVKKEDIFFTAFNYFK
ncbi:helix-turn-helix transcriptional regulator [Lactobacillus amylovorus]|uniref:helix-turn-helix transcriptional regulator n=1 Tax=Lactobacillus amylovorus TaxID=1604 RepID=UPI00201DFA60|nr:helix-turn-helix transcriptional regulator [Lactobacillus amylovorus]